jgi:transposase
LQPQAGSAADVQVEFADLAELHEQAFRRLGGSTRVAVLDNLREGVLSPDIYDPCLNPLYRDILVHYGVTALPCKVRDPD